MYPQVIPMKSLQLSKKFSNLAKKKLHVPSQRQLGEIQFYSLPCPKQRLVSYGNYPKVMPKKVQLSVSTLK